MNPNRSRNSNTLSQQKAIVRGTTSRREKYYMHNSLVALPLMLLNQPVLIDMRNETSVAGRIVGVDGFMNINLEEAVYIDQKGLQYEFENFMISARMLRQLHPPDSIDVVPELRKFLEAIGAKPKSARPMRSGKVKRAQERHMQTVMEIGNS